MRKASENTRDLAILVVDDEEAIQRYIGALLRHHGFTAVYTAGSARQALAYFGLPLDPHDPAQAPPENVHIALVLLDIVLPDLSGFDICRRLKKDVPGYLPIMLLTGFQIEDNHARYIESGADDFLLKPFQPPDLLARVGVMLRRKQKVDEADTSERRQIEAARGMPGSHEQVGPYVIETTLAWSGSSLVYRAHRETSGEVCVVKILTNRAAAYEDVAERFRREQEIMREVAHPHIIRCLEGGQQAGCPWYAMEYVDGPQLEQLVHRLGPADFSLLVNVAESTARALDHIHGCGYVHRDVKPQNIYLGADGVVKLGDFGIAVRLGDQRLTQTGFSIGTPIYMAPEQFEGLPVGPTADIYAYGATLYHVVAGRPPFTADNAAAMLEQHRHATPAPLHLIRPGIPAAWDDFIVKTCLAKDPADRPADMQEVLAILANLKQHPFGS